MTSPPIKAFLDLLQPSFLTVGARHDGGLMLHLVALVRLQPYRLPSL